jgi:hypothetical protein
MENISEIQNALDFIYLFTYFNFLQYWSLNSRFGVARQMLYCLTHVSTPLYSGYFGDRILLLCSGHPELRSSYFKFSTVAGMTGMYDCIQFFPIEMGSHKLLHGLVQNCKPPDLNLPSS